MTAMPQDLPRRRPGIGIRQLRGEQALVDPARDRLHVLNATALALWELCDGNTRPEEMVDAVCVLFGEDHAAVERDVTSTLAEFENLGLIEWREWHSTPS